jgi:hypothetical protein
MTGPEHFREAERILTQVISGDYDAARYLDTTMVAMAQMHATLAMAAAAAVGTAEPMRWPPGPSPPASGAPRPPAAWPRARTAPPRTASSGLSPSPP